MDPSYVLIGIILISGFYLAWNIGANDVANAMGTSVGSGALTLRRALVVAAIFEFSGAFFFGSHVSETMQSGIIKTEMFAQSPLTLVYGMLSALIASGIWLQIASYYGWPVSTTHSIVGAIVGFGLMAIGIEAVYWDHLAYIVASWILSPLFGGFIAYLIFSILRQRIFFQPDPVASAKAIMPWLVFVVFTIMSLILLYHGLSSLRLAFDFIHSLMISLLIGAFSALICSLIVRRIKGPDVQTMENRSAHPEVVADLDKAKKHLQKIQSASSGALRFQLTSLIQEMETISTQATHPDSYEATRNEFAVIEKMFGYLQIMSACLMAFAHGANDVANAIGPLSAALTVLRTGFITEETAVPTWTLALGGAGIVIGLATWGWRVIDTIGKKITELTPTRGFAAEFGAATTILIASRFGMPISTTHTLVGAVLGVGLARGLEALNLSMTRDIIVSWIVTVPAGALLTCAIFYAFGLIY